MVPVLDESHVYEGAWALGWRRVFETDALAECHWVGTSIWARLPRLPFQPRACCLPIRAQELYESRGGRPGLPSLISLRFLWT